MGKSKKRISAQNRLFLWAKSAGRCQYHSCNKILWEDPSTASELNLAHFAHIIASSPNGPRGDETLSEQLANEPSNFMLLCGAHHRLIDKEGVKEHSVERLQQMKKDHEKQVVDLTSLIETRTTKIVIYSSNIGKHNSTIDIDSARKAVIPNHSPLLDHVEISLKNSFLEDDETNFWRNEVSNLEAAYNNRIKPSLENSDFSHLSFFGLAPIPLLVKAGSLLSDISHVQVRQLMKEPRTWKWDENSKYLDFSILKPKTILQENNIALVVSTSAKIGHERITKVMPNADIWEIQASEIHNDNIRSEETLKNFKIAFRKALAEIKASYQADTVIGVFPAVSVSIATEMGRVWNGKSDCAMQIYDYNYKTKGFQKAVLIK